MTALGPDFDIHAFLTEYEVHCQAAVHRLVDIGVPATTEHLSSTVDSHKGTSRYVAEVVQVQKAFPFVLTNLVAFHHADGLTEAEFGGRRSDPPTAERPVAEP